MTDLLRGSQGLALLASTTQQPATPQAVRDTNGMTITRLERDIPVVRPCEVNFMRQYYIDTDKRGPTYFCFNRVASTSNGLYI